MGSDLDLAKGQHQVAQIVHSSVIDWLELNETATKLLFRDRKSRLSLFDLRDERRTNLLNFCTYVQWVPNSDVVVAQSEQNLCVWYNTDDPEQVTSVPIAGDVEMVLRDAQLTEVIVTEGNARNAYQLDAKLIEFGTAIEDLDFARAISFLELPERSGDADSMWKHLAQVALEHRNLLVAQRCYAALNDIARVMFLQQTLEIADEAGDEGVSHFRVRARLEIMKKNFKEAERIYLENNALDEAIEMYQSLHQWEEAINLATARNHPDLEQLKAKYYRNLFDSGQEEKAAEASCHCPWKDSTVSLQIKEREGDLSGAIDLYLKANLAAHAARLLLQNPKLLGDDLLVENVCAALLQNGNFERAGALYEQTKHFEKALSYYRKGENFAKAIDVARFAFPEQVVQLEEEWGDHLVAVNSAEAAVSHYLESGKTLKAVDAAIKAREFPKAVEILEVLDSAEVTAEYYAKIGDFYAGNGDYEKAEKMFVDAGLPQKAILMYDQAAKWTDAYRLASEFFGAEKTRDAYLQKAEQLEGQGNLKEAEELYIHIGETSRAVAMYKKAHRLDEMMALMEKYHSEHVQDTHKRLAAEFEEKGDFRAAEEQYMLGGDWKSVVHMYTEASLWEEAFRVAKAEGGDHAQRHVAYLWAKSLGGDSAVRLLQRYGLLDDSIDLACEKSDFAFAFDLARFGSVHRKPEIHLKLAERLEEEGELGQAEEHFLQADKAREAVHMYIGNFDWDSAERIAARHCTEALPDVYIGQARVAIEQKDFQRAESYLLRANRSDIILRYYKELGMWPEAIRIARDYLPNSLPQLQEEYEQVLLKSGAKGAQSFMAQAKDWEAQGEYQRAVAAYLRVQRPVTDDVELITNAFAQAGDLVVKFLLDESPELVEEIGLQLEGLQQFHQAAELYLAANKPELAVRAFLLAKDWAKAKRVASELVPEMVDNVDEAYKEFLKEQGKVGELIDVDVISAIDLFVERGQWEKALDTAKHQNYPPLLDKYVAAHATALIQEDHFLDAVRVFEKYGASANVQNFNMYKKLIDQIVNARYSSIDAQFEAVVSLRNLIFGLNQRIKETETETDRRIVEIFASYQLILHLYALRCALAPFDTAEVARIRLQISVGLLRYADLLQPDRAFFEAGMACREAGEKYENLAFVLLNHCLDICEAIEEENPNIVDSSMFEDTDVPSQFALPQETYLTPQEYEEVKDWVLTVSVDAKVDKVLPRDRRGCYEASTVDGRGTQFPVCVISGYPIIDAAKDLGNGVKADLANWQTFVTVSKTQPTDNLDDVQEFLTKWTKKATTLSL
uniref:TPR_REGION domain-containing protein n=1 Tax=Steinernema glaseri TaxID=37863 RepID=A0A1I7Y2L2_9BILA